MPALVEYLALLGTQYQEAARLAGLRGQYRFPNQCWTNMGLLQPRYARYAIDHILGRGNNNAAATLWFGAVHPQGPITVKRTGKDRWRLTSSTAFHDKIDFRFI